MGKICNTVLNENIPIDFIEEKRIKIKESSDLNYLKWDNIVKEKKQWGWDWGGFGRNSEDFETAVERLKEYVRNRFISLNNLINNAALS